MTSVLIVGGARAYQEGLAEALQQRGRVRTIDAVPSLDAALESLRKARPDVVLLDVAAIDGVGGTRSLVAAAPDVNIVAFGVTESESEIIALAEAGVSGYVPRHASLEYVLEEIETVAHNTLLASPELAAILLRRVRSLASERAPGKALLTARQREILTLIEEGLSNKQIARRLSISPQTVKNHVHNVFEVLGLHSRTEAAAWARRHESWTERD